MKQILFLLCLSFFIVSCEKEEECDSNCGIVVSDDFSDACLGYTDLGYALAVQNECTDNIQTFCVSEYDWNNVYVGDYECVENQGTW